MKALSTFERFFLKNKVTLRPRLHLLSVRASARYTQYHFDADAASKFSSSTHLHSGARVVVDHQVARRDQTFDDSLRLMPRYQQLYSVCLHLA